MLDTFELWHVSYVCRYLVNSAVYFMFKHFGHMSRWIQQQCIQIVFKRRLDCSLLTLQFFWIP